MTAEPSATSAGTVAVTAEPSATTTGAVAATAEPVTDTTSATTAGAAGTAAEAREPGPKDEGIQHVKPSKGYRFRASHIVFTVYTTGWTPEAQVERWEKEHFFRYIIGQWETCPETKKKHFQGYAQMFKRCQGRKQFQRNLGGGKCWHEKARGSSEANVKYCSKESWVGKGNRIEGTEIFEFGKVVQKKGERTDIEAIQNMLRDGASVKEVADSHFKTWTGRYRAVDRYHQMCLKDKAKAFRHVKVHVLHGQAGANKSRTAEERAEAAGGGFYRPIVNNQGQVWFSNYEGEETLILDDFYGNIKFSYMLRLLDGYRMEIERKGGQTYAMWNKVYITSNTHPDKWWSGFQNIPEQAKAGFQRRVTSITECFTVKPRENNGWVAQTTMGVAPLKRRNPFKDTMVGTYKAAEPLHKRRRRNPFRRS